MLPLIGQLATLWSRDHYKKKFLREAVNLKKIAIIARIEGFIVSSTKYD